MELQGGRLGIVLSAENDCVEIEIRDTGHGISAGNLDKIFQPYFSTKETGTGLGLAIAKRIIADHNGKLRVDSTENEGTIFTIRLPRA